jgi:four helix bundle protein
MDDCRLTFVDCELGYDPKRNASKDEGLCIANNKAGRYFAAQYGGSSNCGRQLLRSATSAGANYRAACRAQSHAEFAAKLSIVVEEADESLYRLELLKESSLTKPARLFELLKEANELVAISAAARKTAKQAA